MNRVKLRPWCPVRVKVVVTPGKILSVVDSKVHMMQRMVSGAVDEFLSPVTRNHITIVNEDGPNLHGDEKNHVEVPVHRADKDKSTDRLLVAKKVNTRGSR